MGLRTSLGLLAIAILGIGVRVALHAREVAQAGNAAAVSNKVKVEGEVFKPEVEDVPKLPAKKGDVLRGIVRDAAGKPVAGARIDISTAAPKTGPGLFCPSCYLDCAKWTKSDEQGKFEIRQLEPSLKFRILATAPGKQTATTRLLDPSQETAEITLLDFPSNAPPARILQGEVRSVDGLPIPGALVDPYGAKLDQQRWYGEVKGVNPVVTDERGLFRMLLTNKLDAVDLEVRADGFPGKLVMLLAPGKTQHKIEVPLGTSVTGRLEFEGRPLAERPVAVVQTERAMPHLFIKAVMTTTDRQGRFRFHALPASEEYALFSPVGIQIPGPVLTTALFQANGNGASRDLGTIKLAPGLSLAGKIKMNDGAALPDKIQLTLGRDPAWDLIEVPVEADGRFHIDHLPPESYTVRVIAQGVRLDEKWVDFQLLDNNAFGIRLDDSRHDLEIPLRRLAAEETKDQRRTGQKQDRPGTQKLSGTVVDRQGKLLAGIRVTASFAIANGFQLIQPRQGTQRWVPWMETKSDGSFVLDQLPDDPIELMVYKTYPGQSFVHYPVHVSPEMNARGIRVLFDPSLNAPLPTIE